MMLLPAYHVTPAFPFAALIIVSVSRSNNHRPQLINNQIAIRADQINPTVFAQINFIDPLGARSAE
jgi:hypothetical protein